MAKSCPTRPDEARREQESLRPRVIAEDRLGPVRLVAAVDAHYGPRDRIWAAASAAELPDLLLADSASVFRPVEFPYVPGLLSYREAPAMLAALERLSARPDLLLVDGHGFAHPRRFGIACHVGVLADLPTIGIGKTRLVGSYEKPGPARGDSTPLVHRGELIGAALRTRSNARPIFVSVGHRISLTTAVEYVLRLSPRYRVPEPIRQADRLSRMHLADRI